MTACFRSSCARRRRSDGKQQRVESCLNSFVITLIKAAPAIKIARTKEQREREERAAEEKRRHEYQEWKYEEDKRIRRLDEQLAAWKRAEEVRGYAMSVEGAIVKARGCVDEASELGKWLLWLRDYARRLDLRGDPTSAGTGVTGKLRASR